MAVIATLFFLGCSNSHNNIDKTVFRYNEVDAITSLDPIYTRNLSNINGVHQLFNGLVQLDNELNIIPCIAKKWHISDDGTLYTFILRNDVFYHHHELFGKDSTRKVIADDFVYSLNRITDKNWASPGAWIMQNVNVKDDGKLDIDAINDTTLTIKLKTPFAPFLGILTMKYCSVVPKEIVEYYGKDFRSNPIGTGPFVFKYWKEDEKLVLLKNDNYFETENNQKLPYLDAVSISFIKEKQTVFLEFIKGNLDYMSGIDPVFMKEVLTMDGTLNDKYSKKFKLISEPYLNTEYLGFIVNDTNSIFCDSDIRKAVNYAIDKEKMLKYLRSNIGVPGYYGFTPPSLMKLNKQYYNYDLTKAKTLVEQSKTYKKYNGKIPEVAIATTLEYSDLINYVHNRFSLIGIPVKIDIYPPAVIKEMRASGTLQCFRGSWVADYPDAENYFSVFYSKNFPPSGPNYFRYSNKDFDKSYKLSLKTTDPIQRQKLYQQMDSILMQDPPFTVLFYDIVQRFTANNVIGLNSNPINLLDLKKVQIKN
ncbi:MAG: ABC transporter substrate-binding protein [Bacteroidales bacterium]